MAWSSLQNNTVELRFITYRATSQNIALYYISCNKSKHCILPATRSRPPGIANQQTCTNIVLGVRYHIRTATNQQDAHTLHSAYGTTYKYGETSQKHCVLPTPIIASSRCRAPTHMYKHCTFGVPEARSPSCKWHARFRCRNLGSSGSRESRSCRSVAPG